MASYPAVRRRGSPRSGTVPDNRGAGPGRRPVARPSVAPRPLSEGTDLERGARQFRRVARIAVRFGRKVPEIERIIRPLIPAARVLDTVITAVNLIDGVTGGGTAPRVPPNVLSRAVGLIHGPNPASPYYGAPVNPQYASGSLRFSTTTFFQNGASGPGTGLIGGQVIYAPVAHMPSDWAGRAFGIWIQGKSGYNANYATFKAYGSTAALLAEGAIPFRQVVAQGLWPDRVGMQPEADYHPNYFPGAGQVPWAFPPGQSSAVNPSVSPEVAEALRGLAPEALQNVDLEPLGLPPLVVTPPYVAPNELPLMAPAIVASASIRPGAAPTAGRANAPGRNPNVHVRQKPGPGVKERKGKMRTAADLAGDVLGGFSEFGDLVDSFYDALPKQYKAKSYYKGKRIRPSWKKRWNALYQNFDKVDMNEALNNVVKNEVQDQLIGRASSKANKFLRGDRPSGIDYLQPAGLPKY